jgi:TRAP-type C4-dicarboxylate transport system permease small subunit
VRSFDMPRWMLMAAMPLSFGMMALEFLRLLVRRESPYR